MVRHKNLVNFGQFLTTILCPIVVLSLSLHFNSRSRIFTRRNFRISRPIAGQLFFKDNFRACPNSISRSKKKSSSISVQKYYAHLFTFRDNLVIRSDPGGRPEIFGFCFWLHAERVDLVHFTWSRTKITFLVHSLVLL